MIRLYTDEDVSIDLTKGLCDRGFDISNYLEAGTKGYSDQEQLEYAVAHGYCILSHNMDDFTALHLEWFNQSREHFGIILSTHEPVGVLIARCTSMLSSLSDRDTRNQLIWLNQYR
jgi:hypothetical protein